MELKIKNQYLINTHICYNQIMTKFLTKEYNEFIPEKYKKALAEIIFAAENSGIKIYLIGGIVRDLILNNLIQDIDITVEGDAIEFAKHIEAVADFKIISVQEKLRTAKVLFSSEIIIDLASTRKEYYTSGGMLPIACDFGCSLKEDVKRRDFTINTLALALTGNDKYSLLDYFGGYDDITNKKIRILHDKSFNDDPSRIVRAVKFQMRFNFNIEEKTNYLMNNYLNNFKSTIPLERIKNEFKQYFNIKKEGIYTNIIKKNIYKLISNNPIKHFNTDLLKKILQYVDESDIHFLYTAFLIINSDFNSERLNLTSEERKCLKETKELLKTSPINLDDNYLIYSSFINKQKLTPVIYYLISEDKTALKYYEELKDIKLSITGKDLINLGYSPSPDFGNIFKKIIKEKLNGNLIRKEDEIQFAIKFLKK